MPRDGVWFSLTLQESLISIFKPHDMIQTEHQHRPSAAEVCFYFSQDALECYLCSRTNTAPLTSKHSLTLWIIHESLFIVSRRRNGVRTYSEREESGCDSQLEKMGFLSFFFQSSRKSLLWKLLTIKRPNVRSRKDGWTETDGF